MGTSAEPSTSPSSTNQSGAAGVTFDEMEQQLKELEAQTLQPDLSKVTLNGDDVPEALRGKTAAEAIARVRLLEETLKTSEIARQQALATANLAGNREPPAPAKPEPEPEPQITAQMVSEAFNDDPEKGIQMMAKMQEQGIARATAQFAQRMEPMVSGSVSSAESDAKRRYADEFEIYADEIKATLAQVPNKQVMSSPASWDDLIAYVRGKDPMKLFKHIQAKEAATAQADAQAAQRGMTGFTSTGNSRPAAPVSGGVVIDATVEEVCRNLGISTADYAKWAKVS